MCQIYFIMKKKSINNTFGLSRSLLAVSSLLILVFNDYNILIPEVHFNTLCKSSSFANFLNIFTYFKYSNIIYPIFFSFIILFIVIIGIYPRFFSVLHFLVSFSIYSTILVPEGGDQINSNLTFLLIPISLFDYRSNHWISESVITNKYHNYIIGRLLLLISVQMGILYLDSGIEKLNVREWSDGTAIYYWFNNNIFGLNDWLFDLLKPILSQKYIIVFSSWSVICLEIMMFGCLFSSQNYKYIMLCFSLVFHFLIMLIHGLPCFFLSMVASLIIYLNDFNLTISQNIKMLKSTIWKLQL
jgi:antimicrobial peptide system SdpB family protein